MSKTVGDYKLIEKIGKGSFADVYKAVHRHTGEKFAVKTIPKDVLSEPKLLAGLKNEIDIMKDFVHENIVLLSEYFSSEKNFYLVLELCPGGDLSKYIRKRKRLDESTAQGFFVQLVSGLSFLSDRGYIHRDLKPANCLLSADQQVLKLADFGFARELSTAALAQTRCGTPLYMAPEILEARDYDGKADVWSTGCIYYEMLVGTCPFKGTNEADLLNNIKTKELSVPPEVQMSKLSVDILVKLLERQPMRRASLAQLLALTAHLKTRSVEQSRSEKLTTLEAKKMVNESQEGKNVVSPALNRYEQHKIQQQQMAAGLTPQSADELTSSSAAHNHASSGNLRQSRPTVITGSTSATESPVDAGASAGNASSMRTNSGREQFYSLNSQHQQQEQHRDPRETQQQEQRHLINQRRNSTGSIDKVRGSSAKINTGAPASTSKQLGHYSPSSGTAGPSHSGVGSGSSSSSDASSRTSPYGHSSGRVHFSNRSSLASVSSSPPSTSPAAVTMGMVGNFIAYVFNPTASTHLQQQQQQQQQQHRLSQRQQHGRSVSFDHGAPQLHYQDYGSHNHASAAAASSSVSPAALNCKPRALVDTFDDAISNISAGNSNTLKSGDDAGSGNSSMGSCSGNSIGDSSGSGSRQSGDEDFVMIDNTSAVCSTAESSAAHNRTQVLQRPQEAASRSSPLSHQLDPQNVLPNYFDDAYNKKEVDSSNHDNKAGVDSMDKSSEETVLALQEAFFASIVQRCEVYCAVVSAIASLGDSFVREALAAEQRGNVAGESNDMQDHNPDQEGFLAPLRQTSSQHPAVSFESATVGVSGSIRRLMLDRYLTSCSLYFHALSILSKLFQSLDSDPVIDSAPNTTKSSTSKLREELSLVYTQLVQRAEECQRRIKTALDVTATSDAVGVGCTAAASAAGGLTSQYIIPQPEPIMLQAAVSKEEDAGMDELLGNLNRACKLYAGAKELIEGVTLTASEPEDQRKLQLYATSLQAKYNSCRQKAADLFMLDA